MKSIRRELLLWLLLGLVVTVAAAGIGTYYQARREAKELFDYQLKQLALSVSNERLSVLPQSHAKELEEDLAIQVWGQNQKLLYSSSPDLEIPRQPRPGYSNVATRYGRWRVFGVLGHDKLVQVAQPLSVYEELAAAMAFHPPIARRAGLADGPSWSAAVDERNQRCACAHTSGIAAAT
jgi:two-component system OmpR family sensor kinase